MATPKAGAPEATLLQRLREPFTADQVKTRPGGGGKTLDYVAIETVLGRLLDLAPDYNWTGKLVHFQDNTAIVEGTLRIDGKTSYGIGAMKNPDADMAVKSANSEAMKNAAKNGFGIALELWDAEHRNDLERQRKLIGNPTALKRAVWDLAKERLPDVEKPTLADVAKLFKVKTADLTETETLESILKAEGVL
jgi:hypothetical protein